MTWRELDPKARRKALIFGAFVAVALLILIWPRSLSVSHRAIRQKPMPMRNAGPVRAATPQPFAMPPQPVATPDPVAKLIGKWEGGQWLTDRGVCHLSLELRPGNDRQSFSAFSIVGCTGSALPGNSKDPVGFSNMMRPAMNPTSASFSGTAQGDGVALRATDNIGVAEAVEGCDMVSMTLKPFGDNRMSVRWQDTGKPVCKGGEMLLEHAR
jgi:hypothetical protein